MWFSFRPSSAIQIYDLNYLPNPCSFFTLHTAILRVKNVDFSSVVLHMGRPDYEKIEQPISENVLTSYRTCLSWSALIVSWSTLLLPQED